MLAVSRPLPPERACALSTDSSMPSSRVGGQTTRQNVTMMTRPTYLILIGFSFALTVFAYVAGTALQVLNLPLGLVATSLLVFGAGGLFFPTAINVAPVRFTGIGRAQVGLVMLAALVGFLNLPFANFLMGLFTQWMPSSYVDMAKEVSRIFLRATPETRVVLILAASVAAPVGEELFFRGWLQTAFTRRLRRTTSVLLTAVLFSLVHGDPVGFVARVELGILFGVARAWTGSLWPSIAMHGVHNFVSIAALYLAANPQLEVDRPFVLAEVAPLALGSLLFTLGGLALLWKLSPRAPEPPPAPIVPERPTFHPVPRPALIFATLVLAAFTTTGLGLYAFRSTLPGHDLRVPMPARHTQPPLSPSP